jgi:hypothetical protein
MSREGTLSVVVYTECCPLNTVHDFTKNLPVQIRLQCGGFEEKEGHKNSRRVASETVTWCAQPGGTCRLTTLQLVGEGTTPIRDELAVTGQHVPRTYKRVVQHEKTGWEQRQRRWGRNRYTFICRSSSLPSIP